MNNYTRLNNIEAEQYMEGVAGELSLNDRLTDSAVTFKDSLLNTGRKLNGQIWCCLKFFV